MEEIFLLNKFFFRLSIRVLVAKIWSNKVVQWCPDGDFLGPAFPASREQYISDLHSKFALEEHHVSKYVLDIYSAAADIRRGKKERKKERNRTKYNVRICYAGRP